jgi:hypothetical protein
MTQPVNPVEENQLFFRKTGNTRDVTACDRDVTDERRAHFCGVKPKASMN